MQVWTSGISLNYTVSKKQNNQQWREPIEWERIFASSLSDPRLTLRIYKESPCQTSTKITDSPINNWKNELSR
jgi:hypothetical protein